MKGEKWKKKAISLNISRNLTTIFDHLFDIIKAHNLGTFETILWVMDFFPHPASLIFFIFKLKTTSQQKWHHQTFVFSLNLFFSLADNDTDISKTHLNRAEQIIKLDFYLLL